MKLKQDACVWAPIRGLKGLEKFSRYRVPPEPRWPVVFGGENWKVLEVTSDYRQVELRHVGHAHIEMMADIASLEGYESYDADLYRRACDKRAEKLRKERIEKELPKRKHIVAQTLASERYIESPTCPTPNPEETMDMSHAQWEKLKKRWRCAVLTRRDPGTPEAWATSAWE